LSGLPGWVLAFALVLLLIGLPVLLAPAVVPAGPAARPAGAAPATDEATPAEAGRSDGTTDAPVLGRRHRLFTWRNALLSGAAAFALLLVVVGAFYAARNLGIGPIATLRAQGVLDARDQILLADFASQGADSSLAPVVTEALLVDLGNSDFVSLAQESRVSSVLERMGRQDATLPEDVALEAATREGIKAVLAGEVSRLGTGYVLTARILEPATGNTLASFRTVARGEDDLIDAIDELSASIRSKTGESLRSVARSEPLRAVTTGSLEALRLYSRAVDRADRTDYVGAIPLLERAIETDPEFAMAYRKLAVLLSNTGGSATRIREAATRAHELGVRLTDRERHLADAYYYDNVVEDDERAIEAYESVLAIDPQEPTALNNLGIKYMETGRFEEAEGILLRAVQETDLSSPPGNLVNLYWITRREDEMEAWLDTLEAGAPDTPTTLLQVSAAAHLRRDYEEAHARDEESASVAGLPAEFRAFMGTLLGAADVGRGRLQEARGHWDEARALAERSPEPFGWRMFTASVEAAHEILAAGDSARAAAILEEALQSDRPGPTHVEPGDVLSPAAILSMAGRPDRARRFAEAYLASSTEKQGSRAFRDARLFYQYGQAMGRGRPGDAARLARQMWDNGVACDRARCQGAFELAMALDADGQTAEAIRYYERHLDGGLVFGTPLDAVATGVSLERLALLRAQEGDAEAAREYADRLAAMWGSGDEPLAGRVRRVREALASLAVPPRN
jgi:Tfp pilus assembly protein PilF